MVSLEYYAFGLFLSEAEAVNFSRRYAEKIDPNTKEFSDEEVTDFAAKCLDGTSVAEIHRRIHPAISTVKYLESGLSVSVEHGLFIPGDRQKYDDAPYASVQELAEEFKENFGEFLPCTFDYCARVCFYYELNVTAKNSKRGNDVYKR